MSHAQSLVLCFPLSTLTPLVLTNFKVDDLQNIITSKLLNSRFIASGLPCIFTWMPHRLLRYTYTKLNAVYLPHPTNSLCHLSWCRFILPIIQAKVLGTLLNSHSHLSLKGLRIQACMTSSGILWATIILYQDHYNSSCPWCLLVYSQ